MSREVATAPATTVIPQGYVFTCVETETAITTTIQDLYSTGHTEIALVAIHLLYKTAEKHGPMKRRMDDRAEQGVHYVLQNLRTLVRRTDHVFLCGKSMYFVLLAANLQGAEIVEERLWEALLWRVHGMSEQDLPRPESVCIGHGAFPAPQTSPEELLSAVHAASRHFGTRAQRVFQHAGHASHAGDCTQLDDDEEIPLLAKKLGIPYLSFLPAKPSRRVLQALSARLARELRCYPVGRERNVLTVAMLNPQDHQALERLRQETGLLIFPVLTHPQALDSALKQLG